MTSFLKMCCNWGELFIFLYHFKSNEENISNCLSSDILNENYLHNYLNADQWNTIEQRIANFGELPCKQHLVSKVQYNGIRLISCSIAFSFLQSSFRIPIVLIKINVSW